MRLRLLVASVTAAGALAACSGSPAPSAARSPGPTATGSVTAAAGDASSPTAAATSTACSAAGLSASPQEGLPPPVRATRDRIVAAATRCDLDELAEIALTGSSSFTYSFGGGDDPASYWQQEEEVGREPLRLLVQLLDRPYRQVPGDGSPQFVWPSAFGYDDWASVPDVDRQALRPVYDDRDLEQFERFGAYVGHRIGINRSGSWLFFVAGD